jgi:hypothetical protein
VSVGNRREIGRVARGIIAPVIEDVNDFLAAIGGQIDGQALGAEVGPELLDQALEVGIRGLDLVDDDHARNVALGRDGHEAPCARFDAADRVDHDGDGFAGGHGRDGVADEVAQSGRVDHVDETAMKVEVHDFA